MFCKQCGGKMEDTQGGGSYGTGEKVFRCVDCDWTGRESTCLTEVLDTPKVKSEDVYHNGIKYLDYKAVIKVTDADGKDRVEFITYRADIITAMMKAGLVIQAFEPGDTLTIEAKPHELVMSTANFKVNQS